MNAPLLAFTIIAILAAVNLGLLIGYRIAKKEHGHQ